jgi:hypothetical protein
VVCNQQLDPATIQIDRQGLLDDPHYVPGARPQARRGRENVALLSASVSAQMLTPFVSVIAAPGDGALTPDLGHANPATAGKAR